MLHPRRISRRTEPSRPTSSPNYTSKCSTASHAEFTPESSKLDPILIERADSLPKESKEMLQENQSVLTLMLENDFEAYLTSITSLSPHILSNQSKHKYQKYLNKPLIFLFFILKYLLYLHKISYFMII